MITALLGSLWLGYSTKTKAKVTLSWGKINPVIIFKLYGLKTLLILVSFWGGLVSKRSSGTPCVFISFRCDFESFILKGLG